MRGRGDQSRAQNAPMYAGNRGQSHESMQPMDLVSPELGGMAQLEQPKRGKKKKVSKPGNGGDALVFIAMGLVSAALGLGLYAHVGIDMPVALISAIGLFVSTSFLHVFVRRMQGVDLLDRRVTALEETVSRIDAEEEAQIDDQAEEAFVQIQEQFANEPARNASGQDRIETQQDWSQMPGAVVEPQTAPTHTAPKSEGIAELPPAYQIPKDAAVGFGTEAESGTPSISDPVFDLTRPVTTETTAQHESVEPRANIGLTDVDVAPEITERGAHGARSSHDTRSIDGLVKQLADGMAGASDAPASSKYMADLPLQVQQPEAELEQVREASAGVSFGVRETPPTSHRESGETPLISMPRNASIDDFDPVQTEIPILASVEQVPQPIADPIGQAIQEAAKRGSVDIYLQPILSIEDRKVRFFEVLGRVQGLAGDVIAAEDHVELTRSVGASMGLDRAVLTRAARLLRKLSERRQAQPLFCNITRETLATSNFPRDFADLVGGFRDIAAFLIFEVEHAAIVSADNATISNLRALSSMGFRLSIDKVTNVEQALANGRELDVSFIKLAYEVLMPMQQNQAEARARATTIQSVARDSGMTLIVDRIERKDQLAGAVSAGVNLGQGYLFSEPKPLLPQVAAEVADDSAAA